ncbi:MAG: hypothetical protein JWN72_1655 [Thermoleophilia bacterium]|nr:hypothetical protein [Thermoleophilia bacterium]
MHEHFADTFNAIEFGIRFQERNRIDEGPVVKPVTAPRISPAAQDHADAIAADKKESAKVVPPKDTTPKSDAKKGVDSQHKPGFLEQAGKDVGTAADHAVEGVANVAKPAVRETVKAIDHATSVVAKNNKENEAAGKKVTDALVEPKGAVQVKNAWDEVGSDDNDTGGATELGTAVGASVDYAAGRIGATVGAAGEYVGTTFVNGVENAVEAGKVVAAPVVGLAKGVVDGVVDGAAAAGKDIAEGIEENKQNFEKLEQGRKDSLHDLGEATDERFADLNKRNDERWNAINSDDYAGPGTRTGASIGAALDTAGEYTVAGVQTGVDYLSRNAAYVADAVGTTANAIGNGFSTGAEAVGSFFGGIFGGGNDAKDAAKHVGGGDHGKSSDDQESDPAADTSRGTSGSGSSTMDDYKYQQDMAKRQAAEQADAGHVSPNQQDHLDQEHADQAGADAGETHTSADQAERQAEAAKPTPIDYSTTANRDVVAKAATEAHLVAPGTTFNANGDAVHTVANGDGYWNIVGQYSAGGEVDTQLWLDTQAANGNVSLDPGDQIVIPGRNVNDLVGLLDLPTETK